MPGATKRDSSLTLELAEKTRDGLVKGQPQSAMLFVVLCATLLLAGVLLVALVPRLDEATSNPGAAPLGVSPIDTRSSAMFVYRDEESRSASRLLKNSVNLSVNACVDFHAYVCGGYVSAVQVPLQDFVTANVMVDVKSQFLKAVRSYIPQSHASVAKAVDVFRGCVQCVQGTTAISNANALAGFLFENDLRFDVRNVALVGKTLELLLRYDMQLFFALDIKFFPWLSRRSRFVRVVASREFEQWKKQRTAFSEKTFTRFVADVLAASGVGVERVAKLTDTVLSIENSILGKLRGVATKPKDSEAADWKHFLAIYSNGALSGTYKLDLTNSSAARYFHAVTRIVDGVNRSVYISWHTARHLVGFANLLPSYGGSVDPKTYCYTKVLAEYRHAVLATHLFKAVNNSRLAEVRKMVTSITQEVRQSIQYSYWIPEPQRAKLESKVKKMRWKLGYATGLSNWTGVDQLYSLHPVPTGTFVTDYLNSRKARMQRFFAMLGNEKDPTKYDFTGDSPRITYSAPNTVSVPAAVMIWPLFNYLGATELNYGLLGSLLVENMMRAFGRDNFRSDAHGSHIEWPKRERRLFESNYHCDGLAKKSWHTRKRHSKRSGHRAKPAANDTRPGVSVGAHALFRAYKKAAAGDRSLRGFENLSGDQLFFIGRCLAACGDSVARKSYHRCNVMARHSSEFAHAFRCGDWSSPKGRCDMW